LAGPVARFERLSIETNKGTNRIRDYCTTIRRTLAQRKFSIPTKNDVAISADERTIYRTVLQLRKVEAPEILNVSITTYPLDLDSPMILNSGCESIDGIRTDVINAGARSFHELSPDLLKGVRARFVDPNRQSNLTPISDPNNPANRRKHVERTVNDAFANGLLSMSAIVFDSDHQRALVSFQFFVRWPVWTRSYLPV
jgi:hypothetical protein